MAVRESRLGAGRDARVLRRRGRLHVACGVAGLFIGAGWTLSAANGGAAFAERARWWALSNLMACTVIVVLGRFIRRAKQAPLAIDGICTCLAMALIMAWTGVSGGAGSWLLGVPPALIVAHWVSAGRTMGALTWGAASVLYVGAVLAARAELLTTVSPFYAAYAHEASPSLLFHLGVLGAFAGAAFVGWEVSRATGPRRSKAYASVEPSAERGELFAGKYRLRELIGEGGMGRVHEAERVADGKIVALKILHDHLSRHPGPVARFRREVEIVSRLPTDRIAAVLDHGRSASGREYIAMERLRGEDLDSRLRRVRRLSCEQAVALVDQLAAALDTAAAAGVVHRDVQPRNIFLVWCGDGVLDARLLDFGACRLGDGEHESGITRGNQIFGTPGFLSPEQVSGEFGEIGPHTDVFALGCIAYLALCGQRAFEAQDPAHGVYEVLNHHPVSVHTKVRDLPEAIDWVLSLALAKRPDDRYPTAGDFARDLRAAASGALSVRIASRAVSLARACASPGETLST